MNPAAICCRDVAAPGASHAYNQPGLWFGAATFRSAGVFRKVWCCMSITGFTAGGQQVHRSVFFKAFSRNLAYGVGQSFGFDPVTITAIATALTTLIPVLMSCGRRTIEPSPENLQAAIREHAKTEKGRKQLVRQMAGRMLRDDTTEAMTRSVAFEASRRMLDEILNFEPAKFAALAGTVQLNEYVPEPGEEPKPFPVDGDGRPIFVITEYLPHSFPDVPKAIENTQAADSVGALAPPEPVATMPEAERVQLDALKTAEF